MIGAIESVVVQSLHLPLTGFAVRLGIYRRRCRAGMSGLVLDEAKIMGYRWVIWVGYLVRYQVSGDSILNSAQR